MVTIFGDSNLMLENMQQAAMEADFMSLEIDSNIEMDKYMAAYESLQFLKDSGVSIAEEGFIESIKNAWRTFIRWINGLIEKVKAWWKNLWKKNKKSSDSSNSTDDGATSSETKASTPSSNESKAEEVKKVKEEIKKLDEKIEKAEEKKENATSESEKKAANAVIDKTKEEKMKKYNVLKKLDKDFAKKGMDIVNSKPLMLETNSNNEQIIVYPNLEKYVNNLAGICKEILAASVRFFDSGKLNYNFSKNTAETKDAINNLRNKLIKDKLCLGYIDFDEFKKYLISNPQTRLVPSSEKYVEKFYNEFHKKTAPVVESLIDYLKSIRDYAEHAVQKDDTDESKILFKLVQAKGKFASEFVSTVIKCTNVVYATISKYRGNGRVE